MEGGQCNADFERTQDGVQTLVRVANCKFEMSGRWDFEGIRAVMVGSAGSSEPQSGVTTEKGMGEVENEVPRRRQRCVVPSVRPRPRHGSDQLVPVYWDQTVPVWSSSCEEVGPPSSKRRQQGSNCSLRRFGGGATMFVEKQNTSCSEELSTAPQVSFDVITSMYRSSLVEVCYERCSARGDQGWVLGALLLKKKKRIIMRQRPTFAGRCSRTELSKKSSRSMSLLSASVDHGMSSSNSQCRMNQLQHHRDHPLYTSSMLTTSSS